MKKLFLFIVIFVNINLAFGQAGPFVRQTCVAGESALSFWMKELSKKEIITDNTSIEAYMLYGKVYYLVFGENHSGLDSKPLLVMPLENGCWKEIKNLYPCPGNMAPQAITDCEKRNMVDVAAGCVISEISFFREAKFIGFFWKKYPNADYWRWIY